MNIYKASSDSVCIFSLAARGKRVYWAESCSGNGIHSVIATASNPQATHTSIPAAEARSGVAISGDKVYWTGIGKVYIALVDTGNADFKKPAIDLGTSGQLKGIVVV